MKFSLQSKSSAKPKPIKSSRGIFDDGSNNKHQEDSEKLQFVTQFDASETLAAGTNEPKIAIIPPIANEWRPHKRMKNLNLPIASQSDGSGGLSFEIESGQPDGPDSKISYGLNLREKSELKDADNGRPRPAPPAPVEAVLLQKLKDDLERLPEDRGMEEFDDVPVEGFGAALLAGYGWQKGRGIGKNAKKDVEVVQYEKRADKQGLGFLGSDKEEPKAKRKSSDASKKSRRSNDKEESKPNAEKNGKVSWLRSHIRVKIICKKLKGGRLYLKKGEVVDVVGPMQCDILMDESRQLIQNVSQEILETAVPRPGGRVLVLYGKHEGVYGTLVRRDSKQESALVQDANTQQLLHLPLDQVAEYMGDPSGLEY